ncbi:MAG: hypothetical protein JXB26_15610 [Candidatus Aminicenantes bacterium]|nr:hypothetical protein [Candidatus Aminicenantes bacterium]
MKKRGKRGRINTLRPGSLVVLIASWLLIQTACVPSRILLSPLPQSIESLEGYASIRISGNGVKNRAKFSFVFRFPREGKIQVKNVIGKTLFQILIKNQGSYFILPSKRVYWQGDQEDLIEKFLGFSLSMAEMAGLMTGNSSVWQRGGISAGWEIEKDASGKILSGERKNFRFQVKEYINGTSAVKELEFEHDRGEGCLKILQIRFNGTVRNEIFSEKFLVSFNRKTWPEIERLLNNEK